MSGQDLSTVSELHGSSVGAYQRRGTIGEEGEPRPWEEDDRTDGIRSGVRRV